METIAPEHGFWNGQMPVSGVPGDDLVSDRFLEHFVFKQAPLVPTRNASSDAFRHTSPGTIGFLEITPRE
jgi:hypothetical protein